MKNGNTELLELTIFEQNKNNINKLIDVEIDTVGDIMKELADTPYVDKIIKFCKVGYGILNIWQLRKIARFLKGAESISDEEKDKYLSNLSKKDKQRISGFLTNLLYITESEEKAEIFGLIYAARVRNSIDNEEMLRLCSSVNRVFVFDLPLLSTYVFPYNYVDYHTDNLYAAGLLEQLSSAETQKHLESISLGVRKYKLNAMGDKLRVILSSANYQPKMI